jgi:cytochrome b6-f complex iron-sulfur subunit
MQAAVVVLAIVLALLAVVLLVIGLRTVPPAPSPDTPATTVDRRRFLNRAMLGSLSLFAIAMGAGSAGFLWPPKVKSGKFGTKIVAGKRSTLLEDIKRYGRPIYNIDGKFYIVRYDGNDPGYYARAGALAGGLMAIYQKCSHLGCRVPYCPTSGWFECPCHDARFNGAGEYASGPAPAGLWHFPIEINADDDVIVDTANKVNQPPRGFFTTDKAPAGAFCVTD